MLLDLEKYNWGNKHNCKKPNYKVDDKEIYFDIYVSSDKEVCIIGSLDNNYICWASITSLDESDLIVSMIDYILKREPARGFKYLFRIRIALRGSNEMA